MKKYIWPYQIASFLWRKTFIKIRDKYMDIQYNKYWKEHRVSEGKKNGEKTFFVVRRREVYIGLFSYFMTFVYQVAKAIEKGYIPVIDMQNSANMYLKKEQVGKVNAWEYFFEQPYGYGLEDIKGSKNIIWGSGWVEEMFPYMDINYLLNTNGEMNRWKYIAHNYFRINLNIKEEIEKYLEPYTNYRMLGVLCRGTDYTYNKPKGHAIQPSIEQMFIKIDEIKEIYMCDIIFLGTEDKSIYMAFKEKYEEKVITNRNDFIEYNGENAIGKLVTEGERDLRKEGIDYLMTISILAHCNCFIGGHTSGTVGVMLMNQKFDYTYIFDLGTYE